MVFAVLSWMMLSFAGGFGFATAIISHALAELFAVTIDGNILRINVQRMPMECSSSSVDAVAEVESRSEKKDD